MARTLDTGQHGEGFLKSSSQSQTVTRAIDVLNLFTAERPELGIMEMSRLLGISKSSVHRLATTLESAGYLRQDRVNQRYQLGFKVLQLANILLTSLKFRDIALPWMEQLRTQTNETVSLYVADRDARICIERLEGTQDIRFVVDINMRLPLHIGAAGKLLLAHQSEAMRKRLMVQWQAESKSLFSHSHGSLEEFERELISIQKQGYAISIGERVTYAAALAVPILNYRGEILAALTISGPSVRFTEEHIFQWLPPAQNAAQAISAQMGYHPST
jgi:IclR family transcriptional regulator, KDG regulon repressor